MVGSEVQRCKVLVRWLVYPLVQFFLAEYRRRLLGQVVGLCVLNDCLKAVGVVFEGAEGQC